MVKLLWLFIGLLLVGCNSDIDAGNSDLSVVNLGAVVDGSDEIDVLKIELEESLMLYSQILKDAEYWENRFVSLSVAYNAERNSRTEYRIAMQECLVADKTYDSSGIFAFKKKSGDWSNTCGSGSMMPVFGCKSEITFHKVRGERDLQVCDVIGFGTPDGRRLLHRIWKIYEDDKGVTRYVTAGDNAQQFDNYDPRFSDIFYEVGKVVNN